MEPAGCTHLLMCVPILAGKGSYHNKAVQCQFVGEWSAGGFISGHWVLKDGSLFQGTFANGVNPVRHRLCLHYSAYYAALAAYKQ